MLCYIWHHFLQSHTCQNLSSESWLHARNNFFVKFSRLYGTEHTCYYIFLYLRCNITSHLERIFSKVNKHERIKIRFYLGKLTNWGWTLQRPFYDKLVLSSFISYSTVQEKGWLKIIIQISSAMQCCDYLDEHLALNI